MEERNGFILIIISLIFVIITNLIPFFIFTPFSMTTKEDTSKKEENESSDKDFKKIKKIIKAPEEVIKYLKEKEWYKQKEEERELKREIITTQDEADLSSIQKGASEEISTIFVLLGELPFGDKRSLFAPVFLTEQENIFKTGTDFSFRWVGYKGTARFVQKGFPWNKTDLTETLIGSFLFASGTNLGFTGGTLKEEKRFYTNYTSEIISLKYKLPFHLATAITLDSRQYFFIKRDTHDSFIMPKNHINIFPRIDIIFDHLSEKGIDQLTKGIKVVSWIGYGIRNRWERWGEPPNYEIGAKARTFAIYSITLTSGLLYMNNHNMVIRTRYKGGIDNDFITRPRFGGTIDNAKLDIIHGFTIDQFRVNQFGLINMKYGFNIFKRLRMNLFLDYSHIFSPTDEDIFGSGYGFRIIAFGGLPIWITHGIGKRLCPEKKPIEQVVMIMTVAGW